MFRKAEYMRERDIEKGVLRVDSAESIPYDATRYYNLYRPTMEPTKVIANSLFKRS